MRMSLDPKALPVLAPHCRVITLPPDEILIVSDVDELRLTGPLFCDLSRHLAGLLTVPEITARMVADGTASLEEVPAAVDILWDRGYVVDAREHRGPEAWYRLWWGGSSGQAHARVQVISVGETPSAIIERSLAEHGLAVATDTPDVIVLVVDDYLNPDIDVVTSQARVPVLLAMAAGVRPTVGPWLGGPGPCHTCLAVRLRFNRQVESQSLTEGDRMGPVARGWTPTTAAHTAAEIALAVERRALGRPNVHEHADPSVSHMVAIDHLTGDRSIHHVVRRPQCPECGSASTVDSDRYRIVLTSGVLDAKDDGSYRRLTPQQTIDTYGHHVSSRTGVVERLMRTSPEGSVVHVVESGINLATTQKGAQSGGFRQSAGGKGTTAEQARAGALAEAIERFSATYTGDEPTIVSSLEALGDEAIDPRALTLFSEQQYATRDAWNATHKAMHGVPKEFDPSMQMEWSPTWSLSQQRRLWLPTPFAYYMYAGQHPRNGCMSDSNGNAAGTSMEDAILQGFFELVERDAVATWWYNRIPRPGVDLDAYGAAFGEPYFDAIRSHYSTELDRDVWALDITSDLGVPAFAALSRARTGRPRVLLGFGAHRDPRGALLRALTEMNQMLGMIPSLENDHAGEPATPREPERLWWQLDSLSDHPHLLPAGPDSTPDLHAHDWTLDGKANVERAIGLIEAKGMQMHVLNCTHPDIGMPVVKVMVPGMRFFWPRLAPGRLYDVPVQLGWRERPLTEDELNPTPIFW
ncbi:MAG: TOMM precursor leader peptide-binding protein [Actinobacteria bacterium]|uniref:Unannotated protein n=1 Tax=freshwater metagenome TaxID=449393 RepID=A0A6J7DF45_9ZZZZ|nr:TOMM precursor leader peptide-binding protein [Actinomycetota bacterium]